MPRPRRSVVLGIVLGVVAVGGPAFAYWTISSTGVTGKTSAHGLAAPSGASASALSASAIRISYNPSTQSVSTAQYRITRSSGPGSPVTVCTVASTTTSCDDTGLSAATAYGYTVAAVIPNTNWASGSVSAAATTPAGADSTAPVLQTLELFDNDKNGKLDQVVATYNEALNSSFPGSWTANNLPGNSELGSPSVPTANNKQVVIPISESGADTAVGSIKLSLANNASTLPRDAAGNKVAPITNMAPADKAAPVITAVSSANGAGNSGGGGKMEPNDTFTVTFSEPIAASSLPGSNGTQGTTTVTMADGGGGNSGANDTLTIAGVTGTVALADPGYVATANASVTYSGGAVVLSDGGKTLTFTVGNTLQSGSASSLGKGKSGGLTVAPAAGLKDGANNAATGSFATASNFAAVF